MLQEFPREVSALGRQYFPPDVQLFTGGVNQIL
jgi:hypothetical protein